MVALEVGCRGVIDQRNNANIEVICNEVGIHAIKKMRGALGRLALIGSFRIWLARSSQQWSPGEFFVSQDVKTAKTILLLSISFIYLHLLNFYVVL